MRYIRRVRLDDPGTKSEHISAVQSSTTTSGYLTTETRTQVVQNIDSGYESYRSHNDRTGDEAPVVTRTSASGTRYITTVADGGESNNLLKLPRF